MHITTNRLHSAAAAAANFVSVLQSNEAEFQRAAAAKAAFFYGRFLSLSLPLPLPSAPSVACDACEGQWRLISPIVRSVSPLQSLPSSLPPRISIRLPPPPSVRPSQMKSVDQNQMAADAVCCTEVVMRAVQCSGVSGRIYSYNAIDPPLPFCSAVASIHPSP